jgi:drug/metabolite transporter (DMT)-like permease
MHPPSQLTRGLFLMALGIALMSVMDAFIKYLTSEITAPQVLFLRSFFGIIPLLFIIQKQGGLKIIKTKRPVVHMARAFFGGLAFVAFTIGLRDMSLSNALAICFAAPFFMIIFSFILNGDKVGLHRLIAMLIGFGGVLIVLQPDDGLLETGAIYMIVVAASYAMGQIVARRYKDSEPAISFSFWTSVLMSLAGALFMIMDWHAITWLDLFWALCMGVSGGLGHYYMTKAIQYAPPAIVSPVEYSALIWAMIFDLTIWSLYPQSTTLIGSGIIMGTGLYILWREHKNTGKNT